MWESAKIVGFSVLCITLYGVLHDQVTAHIAVEYFTIAHPEVLPTRSPFWLAVGWGVIATWWMGLILGGLLALSSRVGSWPKTGFSEVRHPVFLLMVICAVLALIFGVLGWALTELRVPGTIGHWTSEIHFSRHAPFAFAAWAHTVSYLAGGIGGLTLCLHTLARRRKLSRSTSDSPQTASTSSTNSG